MRISRTCLLLALSFASGQIFAGGATSGGASEWTQVLNNIQLVDSYAQGALGLQQQIIQSEQLIRSLQDNPVGAVVPDLNQLARNQASMMALGNEIGNNMSKVDQSFAKTFSNPQAQEFGLKFKLWSNEALKAQRISLDSSAGYQEDSKKNEESILRQLTNKLSALNTPAAKLQAIGDVNAAQLKSSQDLTNLFAQQQAAQAAYMAAQISKDQAVHEAQTIRFKAVPIPADSSYKNPKF